MDIDLLKTFLEVQRTRHFGRAADNLFLTQSAISARIRQLEDELGVQLFKRDRNNIQLTAAGQKLMRHAEAILASWNRARLDIATAEYTDQYVACAAPPGLWDVCITDWLKLVQKHHTQIALAADCHGSEQLLRRVTDGSLDFALLHEPPQLPELVLKPVCRFRLLLVATQPNLTAEQAFAEGYIYVDWGRQFANQHARASIPMPSPMLRIALGSSALALLLNNGGAAYLAEPQVRMALQEKSLHTVADAAVIEQSVYAVYRQDSERQNIIDELLELLASLPALQASR